MQEIEVAITELSKRRHECFGRNLRELGGTNNIMNGMKDYSITIEQIISNACQRYQYQFY